MIICNERKIGIFLVPKNGAVSLHSNFKNVVKFRNTISHINYTWALDAYPELDLPSYKFYCFYRDPIERFNSAFKYYKRQGYKISALKFLEESDRIKIMQQIVSAKEEKKLMYNVRYREEYDWLSQDIKNKLESITVDQVLTLASGNLTPLNTKKGQQLASSEFPTFAYQKVWMDFDIDLTLLPMSDYNNQLKFLLSLFGIERNSEEIIHTNKAIKSPVDRPFTPEEIAKIKTTYEPDYEFFRSKNIIFE